MKPAKRKTYTFAEKEDFKNNISETLRRWGTTYREAKKHRIKIFTKLPANLLPSKTDTDKLQLKYISKIELLPYKLIKLYEDQIIIYHIRKSSIITKDKKSNLEELEDIINAFSPNNLSIEIASNILSPREFRSVTKIAESNREIEEKFLGIRTNPYREDYINTNKLAITRTFYSENDISYETPIFSTHMRITHKYYTANIHMSFI